MSRDDRDRARARDPLDKAGAEELPGLRARGYGWRTGKSLAMAMVRPECAALGTEVEVRVLGQTLRATVIADSPYDPENKALRG